MKKRTALLSVSHKDGIAEFATELVELGFTIYSSGGTYLYLIAHGVAALPVSDLVGGGAILGDRVKTLSREVHAGLLARKTLQKDLKELAKLAIPVIDLLCVDMYPLEAEIAKEGHTHESVIEQTDIGGPAMIRSGAKGDRIVICDPKDRERVIEWIKAGEPEDGFVEELAAKGEFTVSKYCMASARFRSGGKYIGIFGERVFTCKAENAWQGDATYYKTNTPDPLAVERFSVVEGNAPSYNNWVDVDRLLQTMTHIGRMNTIDEGLGGWIGVGTKHGNAPGAAINLLPCDTAAAGANQNDVLRKMVAGDPQAIFGGLIMTNFGINEGHCEALLGNTFDGIIAPSFTEGAKEKLKRTKTGRCRFIINPALETHYDLLDTADRFRYVRGGFLTQANYTNILSLSDPRITWYGEMTPAQKAAIRLGIGINWTSNSNTITLVNEDLMLLGNAVCQQSRVGAAELAVHKARKAGHNLKGCIVVSDSFFPFPDGLQVLIDAGAGAVFTTSGSRNDHLVIELCQERGVPLAMIPDELARGFFH